MWKHWTEMLSWEIFIGTTVRIDYDNCDNLAWPPAEYIKPSEMDQVLHTVLVGTQTHLTWNTLFFFAVTGINSHSLI